MNVLTTFGRWTVISLIVVGCAFGCGKKYPQVVYPPRSPFHLDPDLVLEIPSISIQESRVVQIPEITIPKRSAKLVIKGTFSHPMTEQEQFRQSLIVCFARNSGEPSVFATGFPDPAVEGEVPVYEFHVRGPSRPGKYRFLIRTLPPNPEDALTRAEGVAIVQDKD